MRLIKATFFILLTTCCLSFLHGQSIEFKRYHYFIHNPYFNTDFSFDIPKSWSVNDEYDGTGYQVNCTPTSDSEIVKYNDCYGGLIFRLKYLNGDIDSALMTMGLQKKSEGMYLTRFEGKIKIEITSKFKGDTYDGLHYTISNDINCKTNQRNKVVGHYQYIYFSDGKQTICIITNGRSFDENIFNRIKDTFKFN